MEWRCGSGDIGGDENKYEDREKMEMVKNGNGNENRLRLEIMFDMNVCMKKNIKDPKCNFII